MSNRKLDELATDIDDAARIVEDLQDGTEGNTNDKLEELSETLEEATETIDDLEERED